MYLCLLIKSNLVAWKCTLIHLPVRNHSDEMFEDRFRPKKNAGAKMKITFLAPVAHETVDHATVAQQMQPPSSACAGIYRGTSWGNQWTIIVITLKISGSDSPHLLHARAHLLFNPRLSNISSILNTKKFYLLLQINLSKYEIMYATLLSIIYQLTKYFNFCANSHIKKSTYYKYKWEILRIWTLYFRM